MAVLLAVTALITTKLDVAVRRFESYLASGKGIEVTVAATISHGGQVEKTKVGLASRHGKLRLHWTQAPDERRGPLDWYYEATAGSLRGWDLWRRERLEAKGGISQLYPSLPEPVKVLLVKNAFGQFASPMIHLKGWHEARPGHWLRTDKRSTAEFDFDGRTGALTLFQLKGDSSTTKWSYSYKPFSESPPSTRENFVLVPAFLVPTENLKFSDPAVAGAARKAIWSYDSLRDFNFEAQADGVTTHIWRSNLAVGQSSNEGSFVYAKGRLKLETKKGSYKGKVKPEKVLEKCDELGLTVDPLTRCFILRTNFAKSVLGSASAAMSGGSITVDGLKITIIELKEDSIATTVDVDSTGLVRRLRTVARGSDGSVIRSSERTYRLLPPSGH